MEYKIIMNNGDVYYRETPKSPSDFLGLVNSQRFIRVYKYTNDGWEYKRLTVFLATRNISEIMVTD